MENGTNGTSVSLKELSHFYLNKSRTDAAYGMMTSGIARDILARDGLFCFSRLIKESMALMSKSVVDPMVFRHRLCARAKAM